MTGWASGSPIASMAIAAALADGTTAQGPLAITEDETTVIVPRGFTVTGRADGVLDIRRDA